MIIKIGNNKNKGLTLVEIILVIFLFSIILTAIFSVLAAARSSWKSGSSQLSVQQEARRGLNTMAGELRQARLSTITGVPADGSNNISVTFQIPDAISESSTTWSKNIQYSVGGLNSAQLLRTQDGQQRVLANNVSALSFIRDTLAPATINISITAQKSTFPGFSASQSNITLNTEVQVRN